MADFTRTFWSSVPELRFDFENAVEPDGVTTLNWKDSGTVMRWAPLTHQMTDGRIDLV